MAEYPAENVKVFDPATRRWTLQNRHTGASAWAPLPLPAENADENRDSRKVDITNVGVVRLASHNDEHDIVCMQCPDVEDEGTQHCHFCLSPLQLGKHWWYCHECDTYFCSLCVEHCLHRETKSALHKLNAELGPGWRTAFDMLTRKFYFYNAISGTRTWFKPAKPEHVELSNAAHLAELNQIARQSQEDIWVTEGNMDTLSRTIDGENFWKVIARAGKDQTLAVDQTERDKEKILEKEKHKAALMQALKDMEEAQYTCNSGSSGYQAFVSFHAALLVMTQSTYSLPPEAWHMEELSQNVDGILGLMASIFAWELSRCNTSVFVDVLFTLTPLSAWHDAVEKARKGSKTAPVRVFLDKLAAKNAEWHTRYHGLDALQYSVACLQASNKRRDEMLKESWIEEQERSRAAAAQALEAKRGVEKQKQDQQRAVAERDTSRASEGSMITVSSARGTRYWPVGPRSVRHPDTFRAETAEVLGQTGRAPDAGQQNRIAARVVQSDSTVPAESQEARLELTSGDPIAESSDEETQSEGVMSERSMGSTGSADAPPTRPPGFELTEIGHVGFMREMRNARSQQERGHRAAGSRNAHPTGKDSIAADADKGAANWKAWNKMAPPVPKLLTLGSLKDNYNSRS